MLALETLLPLVTLLAIAGLHLSYWRRQSAARSQHVIDVVDLMNQDQQDIRRPYQTFLHAGQKSLAGKHVRLEPEGQVSSIHRKLFSAPADRPTVWGQPVSHAAPRVRYMFQSIVCEDDLVVETDTVFLAPVKVGGDLIVPGNARFQAPLTINGFLKAIGSVHLCAGAVVKEDALISGQLTIGATKDSGWIVARTVSVEGKLLLNGTIDTTEGIYF
jgi:hypothetical protein